MQPEAIARGPLVVSAFFDEVLGVGRAGRLTADWLEEAGLPVVRHDLRPSLTHQLHGGLPFPGPAPGGVWLIHANAPEARAALLAHAAVGWASRYRIGYWAWETPTIPRAWAEVVPLFNEVWTPSRFVADAVLAGLKGAGLSAAKNRIRVMPHAPRDMSGVRPDRVRFNVPHDAVAVLCAFDLRSTAARKNPWGGVEAWLAAFPEPVSDRILLVKLVGGNADVLTLQQLKALAAVRHDVVVIDQDLSDSEMDCLTASVDIVLSLHRSEGFGMVLAEAMAMGLPVIATGWSGNMDFMDSASAVIVPYELRPIHDPTGRYAGVWAEPDVAAAAAALQGLAVDSMLRRRIGEAARDRMEALRAMWSRRMLATCAWGELIERHD